MLLSAQYHKPPDIVSKTIRYELPELIVNNKAFINGIDSVVFNDSSNVVLKRDKYLRILIKEDGEIRIVLSEICGNDDVHKIGYLERNNLTYIIMGENVDEIFTASERKKTFQYVATFWGGVDITEDDLQLWVIKYENGQLELCYPRQAQNREFIKPEFDEPTFHTDWLSQVQADSVFIKNLNDVLFDRSLYNYNIEPHFWLADTRMMRKAVI
jgi:hypothetical protein